MRHFSDEPVDRALIDLAIATAATADLRRKRVDEVAAEPPPPSPAG